MERPLQRRLKRWLRVALMPILIPIVKWYLKQNRTYRYRGIALDIPQTVFHPGLFFSTKFLIQYLNQQAIADQNLLELGAGSGLISLFCMQKGARVTASDINQSALANLKQNAQKNKLELQIVYSDLFDQLEDAYDWIVINPPYYPRKPKDEQEMAWFCGEEFEYFHKLAQQLPQHLHDTSKVLMVLSEDCDIQRIESILATSQLNMQLVEKKEFWLEENYIFSLNLA